MDKTTVAALIIGALALYMIAQSGDGEEDTIDSIITKFDEVTASAGPIENMKTSKGMLDMLKRREGLSLSRYQLDDGGYTWGYGHYSKSPDALPLTISKAQAESIFADDVANRGEKYVKLYIKVDLTQNEFDALVSIAFNMSPQSFKKFAASVNNGDGIDGIAAESISWVNPKYTNGIANRRQEEMNVFNNGVYA